MSPRNDETLHRALNNIQGSTHCMYFEDRVYNTDTNEFSEWMSSPYSRPDNNLELTRRYAKAMEIGKYIVDVYKTTASLYEEFFPELWVHPKIEGLSLEEPSNRWSGVGEENSTDANGFWDTGVVGVRSATPIQATSEADIANEDVVSYMGSHARRKISDIMLMAHELTHGNYESIVGKTTLSAPEYKKTAGHSIDEGTSVLVELLMPDKLIENADRLGFSETDVTQLKAIKAARISRLKQERSGYTEGTLKILHKVFALGAGKGDNRDVHNGLAMVRQFLGGLDSQKVHVVMRSSPEYLEALQSADPKKWAELFARG